MTRTSIARLADDAPVARGAPTIKDAVSAAIKAGMTPKQFRKLAESVADELEAMTPRTSIARKASNFHSEYACAAEHGRQTAIARLADCAPTYGECPDCGAPEEATRVLGFACEHYHCPMFAPIASPESWVRREAPHVMPIHSCGTRPVKKSGGHGESKGGLPDDREAALGQVPHPPYIDDTPAMLRVHAALEAEARATSRAVIKYRARMYALRPRELDAIGEGLSGLSPRALVWCLIRVRQQVPLYRHCKAQATSLRAAILYARYSRAKARQIARRASI